MVRYVEVIGLVATYSDIPTLKGFFGTQKGKACHLFCSGTHESVWCSKATYQDPLCKENTLRRVLIIIAALSKKTSLLCKALNYLSNIQWTVAAISTQGG